MTIAFVVGLYVFAAFVVLMALCFFFKGAHDSDVETFEEALDDLNKALAVIEGVGKQQQAVLTQQKEVA